MAIGSSAATLVTTWAVATAAPASVSAMCCRSEEHTSELQSLAYLVCRLLLEQKNLALVIALSAMASLLVAALVLLRAFPTRRSSDLTRHRSSGVVTPPG